MTRTPKPYSYVLPLPDNFSELTPGQQDTYWQIYALFKDIIATGYGRLLLQHLDSSDVCDRNPIAAMMADNLDWLQEWEAYEHRIHGPFWHMDYLLETFLDPASPHIPDCHVVQPMPEEAKRRIPADVAEQMKAHIFACVDRIVEGIQTGDISPAQQQELLAAVRGELDRRDQERQEAPSPAQYNAWAASIMVMSAIAVRPLIA